MSNQQQQQQIQQKTTQQTNKKSTMVLQTSTVSNSQLFQKMLSNPTKAQELLYNETLKTRINTMLSDGAIKKDGNYYILGKNKLTYKQLSQFLHRNDATIKKILNEKWQQYNEQFKQYNRLRNKSQNLASKITTLGQTISDIKADQIKLQKKMDDKRKDIISAKKMLIDRKSQFDSTIAKLKNYGLNMIRRKTANQLMMDDVNLGLKSQLFKNNALMNDHNSIIGNQNMNFLDMQQNANQSKLNAASFRGLTNTFSKGISNLIDAMNDATLLQIRNNQKVSNAQINLNKDITKGSIDLNAFLTSKQIQQNSEIAQKQIELNRQLDALQQANLANLSAEQLALNLKLSNELKSQLDTLANQKMELDKKIAADLMANSNLNAGKVAAALGELGINIGDINTQLGNIAADIGGLVDPISNLPIAPEWNSPLEAGNVCHTIKCMASGWLLKYKRVKSTGLGINADTRQPAKKDILCDVYYCCYSVHFCNNLKTIRPGEEIGLSSVDSMYPPLFSTSFAQGLFEIVPGTTEEVQNNDPRNQTSPCFTGF